MSDKTINSVATPHQLQFNNCLVEFIKNLKEKVPADQQRLLTKYYKYYRNFVDGNKRVEFIQEFVQYLTKYNKEISICDEGLFSEEDQYYPGKPIQLFKGIDFKIVWKTSNLDDKTKAGIWKDLRTLYVMGTYVLKETQRFGDLLKKQQEIIQNIMQSLKMEQKIKDDAERLNEEERKKAAESGFDLSKLQEFFGENNVIMELAMEIGKELNLPNEKLTNPMEAVQILFGKNGSRLQEITSKVLSKLHDVMARKGITEESLMKDAKRMQETLQKKFKGIPGMPNIEKFAKGIADQMTKHAEERRKNAPPGDNTPVMPSLQELTESLSKNVSEMGLGNMEQLQSNLGAMMAEIEQRTKSASASLDASTSVSAPVSTSPQVSTTDNAQTSNESITFDAEQDKALQKELDALKEAIDGPEKTK